MRNLMSGAALIAALALAPAAHAVYVYSPDASYASKEGSGNNIVVSRDGATRVQWFFRPGVFGSTTGPVLIHSLAFRYDAIVTNFYANELTYYFGSDFRLTLNTLGASPSTTADSNIVGGSTVLSGVQTLTFTVGADSGQTKPFGVELSFAQDYLYDPSQGMLVVDWFIPLQTQSGYRTFATLDFQGNADTPDGSTQAFRLYGNALQSMAPVTRFEVSPVPEAGSLALWCAGLAGLAGLASRRRTHS